MRIFNFWPPQTLPQHRGQILAQAKIANTRGNCELQFCFTSMYSKGASMTVFRYYNMTLSGDSPFQNARLYISAEDGEVIFETASHATLRHGSVAYPVGHSCHLSPGMFPSCHLSPGTYPPSHRGDGPPGMILKFDSRFGMATDSEPELKTTYFWRSLEGDYIGEDYQDRKVHLIPMSRYVLKHGGGTNDETWEKTHAWNSLSLSVASGQLEGFTATVNCALPVVLDNSQLSGVGSCHASC